VGAGLVKKELIVPGSHLTNARSGAEAIEHDATNGVTAALARKGWAPEDRATAKESRN
jgi:hypothetical protein